jgi:hypothetical protein
LAAEQENPEKRLCCEPLHESGLLLFLLIARKGEESTVSHYPLTTAKAS